MRTSLGTGSTSLLTLVSLKRFKREVWVRWGHPRRTTTSLLAQLTSEGSMRHLQMNPLPGMKSWIKSTAFLRAMLRSKRLYCQTSPHITSHQSRCHSSSCLSLISNFGRRQRKWNSSLPNKRQNRWLALHHWWTILMKAGILLRLFRKMIPKLQLLKRHLQRLRRSKMLSLSQLLRQFKLLLNQQPKKKLLLLSQLPKNKT